jgi:2-keto-4-pentenoate hydratase/2-oxohepta-3-ene-1,7-dioic acid hydratase in catechol pathway
MRLATFITSKGPRAGLVATDETLIAIDDLVPDGPKELLGVIEAGPALWELLRTAARTVSGGAPLASTTLLAPIPCPRRDVFCVGWNYSEHFAEGLGMRGGQDEPQQLPEYPALFSKGPNTVVGPDAPVWHPAPHSEQLDWEVELAVVIGRGGRDISPQHALEHVFGYTVGNDVSVRDVQRRHGGQWFKGKNFDAHCPLGPWIVTTDEIPDPHTLRITSRINGVTKQDSNTRFMVFKLPRLVQEFSAGVALEPGDLILTGTPEGVGFARKPPEFLRVGDVMEMEIEKIGVLRNRIAERESSEGQLLAALAVEEPS